MNMNTPDLGEQIRALTASLSSTAGVDTDTRSLLLALQRECQRLTAADESIDKASVANHFEELAVRFETDHPAIGTAIRQTIDSLVKAGI